MDALLVHSNGFEQLAISIIGFMIMMGLIIFIHEFGHYGVARLCGVRITDFSIGFGKKIFSKKDKYGTLWSISMIPMGGYVKFWGDRSAVSDEDIEGLSKLSEAEKQHVFYFKPIWQKMAIILAGPLINIIFAFIVLFGFNFFKGVVEVKPVVDKVIEKSAAARNGLRSGDVFLQIDNRQIQNAQDIRQVITSSFGEILQFKILRGNQPISVSFAPDMVSIGKGQTVPIIGVQFSNAAENIVISHYDFIKSLYKSSHDMLFITKLTVRFFQRLFTGKADLNQLSGPVRIGDAAGDALQTSVASFVMLMALISLSVGLVNLLPIPMLDGGHLLFYIFELVGLKANHQFREIAFKAGFVLVICIMIFTIINDIIVIGTQ